MDAAAQERMDRDNTAHVHISCAIIPQKLGWANKRTPFMQGRMCFAYDYRYERPTQITRFDALVRFGSITRYRR